MATLQRKYKLGLAAAMMAGVLGIGGCAQMNSMMGGGDKMMAGGGTQRVTLSGANEVPSINTSASGTGEVTVKADGSVSASIKVTGMAATAGHIHQGAAGANGPVIVPFTKDGDTFTAAPNAKFSEAQLAAFKAGNTYVNVHTAANPGGEIRAQLKGN